VQLGGAEQGLGAAVELDGVVTGRQIGGQDHGLLRTPDPKRELFSAVDEYGVEVFVVG
jgi:hypothetical protein